MIPVEVQKVEDVRAIASYGVMSTPVVVIDGAVVHAERIPAAGRVEQWLKSMGRRGCSSSKSCC